MAIGPVVVAGRDDERRAQSLQLRAPRAQQLVVAGLAPAFDVARVQHEADRRIGVDFVEHPIEQCALRGAVRRVADQRERKRAGVGARHTRQQQCDDDAKGGSHASRSVPEGRDAQRRLARPAPGRVCSAR